MDLKRRREQVVCGILVVVILMVGLARVVLGHYWLTGAFGAYLLVGALLIVCARWCRGLASLSGASEASECS